jgi:hypothetical protein
MDDIRKLYSSIKRPKFGNGSLTLTLTLTPFYDNFLTGLKVIDTLLIGLIIMFCYTTKQNHAGIVQCLNTIFKQVILCNKIVKLGIAK